MATVFGRRYKLTISDPSVTIETILSKGFIHTSSFGDKDTKATKTFTVTYPSDEKITISDLQMVASVKYKKENTNSTSQQTKIEIYNLSEKNQEFIREEGGVWLQAGYQQSQVVEIEDERQELSKLPLIFYGRIFFFYFIH